MIPESPHGILSPSVGQSLNDRPTKWRAGILRTPRPELERLNRDNVWAVSFQNYTQPLSTKHCVVW